MSLRLGHSDASEPCDEIALILHEAAGVIGSIEIKTAFVAAEVTACVTLLVEIILVSYKTWYDS